MGGMVLGPLFYGGGEGTKDRAGTRPRWDTRQVLGADPWAPGPALAHWGQSRERSGLHPSSEEGVLSAGARTWTLRGDPSPGRGGGVAPKGGLISFPRAAEVSAKCLSHLFKFYGAWLAADGPAPGGSGAGSGSLPRPGVAPAGRARIRPGRPDSARRPACDPFLVPRAFPRGSEPAGSRGGVCSELPRSSPTPLWAPSRATPTSSSF